MLPHCQDILQLDHVLYLLLNNMNPKELLIVETFTTFSKIKELFDYHSLKT
jgi:hypothetical protein